MKYISLALELIANRGAYFRLVIILYFRYTTVNKYTNQAELCLPFGYTTKVSKRGTAGVVILDPDEEQIDDETALMEGAGLKAASMNSVEGFGRRRASKRQLAVRKKFKAAAKKCRGRANYQKCMSRALCSFGKKKKYSTKSCVRKSPGSPAANFKIGTVKRGLDKNLWVVRKTSNGVKRWIKK